MGVGNFVLRMERGKRGGNFAAIAEAAAGGVAREDMLARTGWLEADCAAAKKLLEQKKLHSDRAAADGGALAGGDEIGSRALGSRG